MVLSCWNVRFWGLGVTRALELLLSQLVSPPPPVLASASHQWGLGLLLITGAEAQGLLPQLGSRHLTLDACS